jgi:cell shape-determining protein MreD
MVRSIFFDCAAALLVIAIPGYVTGNLSTRFHWSDKKLTLVAALGAVACWSIWFFLSRTLFGNDPFDWLHQIVSTGWTTFVQNFVTLALPVGFAPTVAERLVRASR